jgi:hypothetical protein
MQKLKNLQCWFFLFYFSLYHCGSWMIVILLLGFFVDFKFLTKTLLGLIRLIPKWEELEGIEGNWGEFWLTGDLISLVLGTDEQNEQACIW